MKNIALTAAAILVATSSAFAGSHHHRPRTTSQTAATIDNTYIAATAKPDMVRHGKKAVMKSVADEPGQGIWGN